MSSRDTVWAMTGWITVLGNEAQDLEARVADRIAGKIASGEFAEQDVRNISNRSLRLIHGDLRLSSVRLEKLRRLCQTWDVKIAPGEITSHRKVIGPLIVRAKRMLFPVVGIFLKDFVRQQRDFNAAAIQLIADLSNEVREEADRKAD